jgi:hypothetical protein
MKVIEKVAKQGLEDFLLIVGTKGVINPNSQ